LTCNEHNIYLGCSERTSTPVAARNHRRAVAG